MSAQERKRAQESADASPQKSAKERKRAQKSAKERSPDLLFLAVLENGKESHQKSEDFL